MTNAPSAFTWTLAFTSIMLSAAAQLLMKIGMKSGSPLPLVQALMGAILNPFVIGGLACYGVGAVLWLGVLSRMPLSMAYPLVALAIAIVVVMSGVLLHEAVPPARIGGALLIIAGVVAIGLKG